MLEKSGNYLPDKISSKIFIILLYGIHFMGSDLTF